MDSNILVSYFEPVKCSHSIIHSSGPDIYFKMPCIGYIKKGYVKFFYKGKTIYAYEGDLIYIGFETRYQSIWYGSPDIEWYSVNFDFKSKYAFYDYRFQIIKNYPGDLFEKMYKSYEESPLLAVSYFYMILNDLYTKLEKTNTTSQLASVEEAILHIEEFYNKDISIKQLSEMCHMSESGFFRIFKKATGVTPIAYKHNIMIQHAIDLLTNSDLAIEEVSSRVGFPSSNYFRKIFFKLTDKKPKELRKNS